MYFPDAEHDAEVLCMPGTSGCFFLRSYRRKGSSVPEPCEFEVGRRLAGGRQGEYPKDGVPCALMPPLGSWDNNITDWRVPCALMSTANKGGACCMSGG